MRRNIGAEAKSLDKSLMGPRNSLLSCSAEHIMHAEPPAVISPELAKARVQRQWIQSVEALLDVTALSPTGTHSHGILNASTSPPEAQPTEFVTGQQSMEFDMDPHKDPEEAVSVALAEFECRSGTGQITCRCSNHVW